MTVSTTGASLIDLIDGLDKRVQNAGDGLPEALFLLISRLTPMINVDLLIRDTSGRVLLTWREDEFYGPGWHIPGGIIRFKEDISDRITQVAFHELGCKVEHEEEPIAINEVMAEHRDIRGHFISMLYTCRTITSPSPSLEVVSANGPCNKQWKWHAKCPDDLITQHEMYRQYIGNEHRIT